MTNIDDQLTRVLKQELSNRLPDNQANQLSSVLCDALCHEFAGTHLFVPKNWRAQRAAQLFNGKNATALCEQYSVPRSTLYRHISKKRQRKSPV